MYIGSSYAGYLLCFDPAGDLLVDLGPIHAGQTTFPCRIDEDRQGRLWIGSYGTANLTCYDRQPKSFTHYGRMDDVDMYNYLLVNHNGTIACVIRQTKPHVVLFDPAEERKKIIGPLTTKGEETIDLHRGTDGNLYITSSQGNFQIANRKAVPVDHVALAPPAPVLADGRRCYLRRFGRPDVSKTSDYLAWRGISGF